MVEVLKGKQESDDYPYGRLRCHITFDLEFKPKKGFRFVTQTTNPKTGRVNKPKRSTYSDFMVLHRESETGHVKPLAFDLRGYDDIAHIIEFLSAHEIEISDDVSQWLWVCAINCIRGNARYTRLAEGVEVSDLIEATKVQAMLDLFKNKENFNKIKEIGYDLEAVRALCA